MTTTWDKTTDFVIVGSGAGGMTAALRAHDLGADVLVVEKSDVYGGSSAMSGGAVWVPNNPLMAKAGISDCREDGLAYLHSVCGDEVESDRIEAYVDTAPEMIRYLCDRTDSRFVSLAKYPDYYPERPGGKPGGRSLEPVPYRAGGLGDTFEELRPSHPQELMFGRVGLTAAESHTLIRGTFLSYLLAAWLMLSYFLNIPARMKSRRDTRLTLGNALMGRLRASLKKREVPIWLNTPAEELVVEDGRVTGVVVTRDNKSVRIKARRGVLLAAGGFARNRAMREQYQRAPITDSWSAANPDNQGDGIRMGQAVGADMALMRDAWWTPVTLIPGKSFSWLLVVEKSMPGSIMVNQAGKRFTNEAAPYVDVVNGMYAANCPDAPSIPAYLVFDARYRRTYPAGPIAPGKVQPDNKVSRRLREGFLKRADSLEELAAMMSIDPAGLVATIQQFNEQAIGGKDPDFGRGESLYDRYYSDPKITPNPCLAPIVEPPFYAFEVFPGDLGTKGGLKTDAAARVLDTNGQPIPGLYATGNCSATVMGPSYPGAGGTIGPAMTFGYLAANGAMGAVVPKNHAAETDESRRVGT